MKEPMETSPREKLKKAKIDRNYWHTMARIDTASLSRTLRRVAEIEMICADLEAQIRAKIEAGRNK